MNVILLEKTFELLKERSSFCNIHIADSENFSTEQMDEFLGCHDDFENGILIVKALRKNGLDQDARMRMVQFMKDQICVHIYKMMAACRKQKETITNQTRIVEIERAISFLNDCCLEILTLNNEAIL